MANVAIATLWPPGQVWAIPLLGIGVILVLFGCRKWIFGEKLQKLDLSSEPAAPATVLPIRAEPPQSTRRVRPIRHPHFEFIGLGRPNLYLSNIPQEGARPPANNDQHEGSLPSVTLRFTNLARGTESLEAVNVAARLRIFDESWMHFQDVDYGVWVGSPCEVTDIEVGNVRELVLLLIDRDNRFVGMKDLRHVGNFQFGENYLEPFDISWMRHIEVMLTDQRSHETRDWILTIEMQGNAFTNRPAYPPPQAPRLPQ